MIPNYSIANLLLLVSGAAVVFAICQFDIWLGLLMLAFLLSIVVGRRVCQRKNEWPKTSLIVCGASIYLACLFWLVVFRDQAKDMRILVELLGGLLMVVGGMLLLRWDVIRRVIAVACVVVIAASLLFGSILLDISVKKLFGL